MNEKIYVDDFVLVEGEWLFVTEITMDQTLIVIDDDYEEYEVDVDSVDNVINVKEGE